MFYTLLKFLGWGLLLAFIGGCIGWALRALKSRTELARTRSSMVDAGEVERFRDRVADLDQVVAERDRLRIQLADVRHADSPGIVGADIPPPDAPDPTIGPDDATGALAAPPEDQDQPADSAARETLTDEPAAPPSTTDPDPDPDTGPPPDVDLVAASAVLGKTIILDDLTVVEGIGPKISELCSGVGVTTWRELADTDVDELQSILDAAGSRYAVHKPATWPRQAELLATGRWAEFRAFTEELKGDR